MGECRDCAYSDRPTYKWPCCSCRDTNNGRSMYCPEDGEQCLQQQAIRKATVADVRPVARGHWIEHISDLFPADSTIECDQCHAEQPTGIDDNFCPNCGVDMREPNLDTIKKEAARMDDCPYCLETGNTFNVTKLDPVRQVEVEVVACKKPYLMIRYYSNDEFRNWSVGMKIKYCPMCGRRLADG